MAGIHNMAWKKSQDESIHEVSDCAAGLFINYRCTVCDADYPFDWF